jgi:hypothetical protein
VAFDGSDSEGQVTWRRRVRSSGLLYQGSEREGDMEIEVTNWGASCASAMRELKQRCNSVSGTETKPEILFQTSDRGELRI